MPCLPTQEGTLTNWQVNKIVGSTGTKRWRHCPCYCMKPHTQPHTDGEEAPVEDWSAGWQHLWGDGGSALPQGNESGCWLICSHYGSRPARKQRADWGAAWDPCTTGNGLAPQHTGRQAQRASREWPLLRPGSSVVPPWAPRPGPGTCRHRGQDSLDHILSDAEAQAASLPLTR